MLGGFRYWLPRNPRKESPSAPRRPDTVTSPPSRCEGANLQYKSPDPWAVGAHHPKLDRLTLASSGLSSLGRRCHHRRRSTLCVRRQTTPIWETCQEGHQAKERLAKAKDPCELLAWAHAAATYFYVASPTLRQGHWLCGLAGDYRCPEGIREHGSLSRERG